MNHKKVRITNKGKKIITGYLLLTLLIVTTLLIVFTDPAKPVFDIVSIWLMFALLGMIAINFSAINKYIFIRE